MDFEQIKMGLSKWVPFALLTTLLLDWIRLRAKHRAEEKKHISRIIPDLLELRYAMRMIRELSKQLPKLIPKLLPEEIRKQVPPSDYAAVTQQLLPFFVNMAVPPDDKLVERYRKAVEEIAGFRPMMAFQLRGKERYFDLRGFLTNHLSQIPNSADLTSQIVGMMDEECLPAIEETILLIAKAHSTLLYWKVKRHLRRPLPDAQPVLKKVCKAFSAKLEENLISEAASKSAAPAIGLQRDLDK